MWADYNGGQCQRRLSNECIFPSIALSFKTSVAAAFHFLRFNQMNLQIMNVCFPVNRLFPYKWTQSSVSHLSKWENHFNFDTLRILMNFVGSVVSDSLIIHIFALIVQKQRHTPQVIIDLNIMCQNVMDPTNITLYSTSMQKLFYIGYSQKNHSHNSRNNMLDVYK